MIADTNTIHTVSHPVFDMDTLSTEREDGWSMVPGENPGDMTEL
jgi:hypothetical protein